MSFADYGFAIWETFYVTVLSTAFSLVLGLPLGVLLVAGDKDGVLPLPGWLMHILNIVINILRSVPFLILMICVFPLTRAIVGTTVGTKATIVPLVVAAFPFVARLVETSLRELDEGVVEAAQSMGATPFQIITKVMIPECLPGLISSMTTALTTILGYSAMSGVIGGGGLGKIALSYGYYRYQTNIMISAMLYVILALGLNIAVGIAGQLVLGYVAFYAVGAYSYALLNQAFGLGFWACLPVGGFMAIVFGLALGFPVLRLRGDYLAIVTLGFGEIVRLVLLNWTSLTGGSGGIKNIPGPSFFGQELEIAANTIFIYYLVLLAVILTIIVISRLKNSRVGLALQALREDEIACEAMGIDLARVKLSAFALSSCWAGFAGVIFAAKTTFINPASFTFMESAMILSMVVLGGMGSIVGVVIAATILILAPEYLRAFSEYRMLIFGAIMVIMMIFRPQGLVTGERRRYRITALQGGSKGERA